MNLALVHHEWKAGAAIARQCFSARAALGSQLLSWILLGLALLVPLALLWAGIAPAIAIGAGAGAPLLVLGMLWWMYLMMALKLQNHPAGALVPAMRARSLRVVAVIGLAGILVLGALLGLLTGSLVLGLVGIALLAAALLAAGTWSMLPWLLFVAAMWPLVFGGPGPLGLIATAPPEQLLTAGTLLVPLIWWLVLGRLFVGANQGPGIMPWFSKGRERETMLLSPYLGAWSLRQACRARKVERLLPHALGPRLGSPLMMSGAPVVLLILAIVLIWPAWLADQHIQYIVQAAAFALALTLQTLFSEIVGRAMYTTQPEQSLLRMAARVPGPLGVNQMLGKALVRQFAIVWAASSVACLALCLVAGASVGEVVRLIPVFLMTLGHGAMALRDYSRAQWRSMGAVASSARYLLGIVPMAIVGLTILHGRMPDWVLILVGIAALPFALVLVRRRLAVLARSPCVFPAGRLD